VWQCTLPVVPQTPPFFSLNPKDGNACVNNCPRHSAIQISLQRQSRKSALPMLPTPIDADRLSIVPKTFYSTADSNNVRNHFLLLSDTQFMASIISHNPFLTKKSYIYLALSDIYFSIIIDHCKNGFYLNRKSGKKCYILWLYLSPFLIVVSFLPICLILGSLKLLRFIMCIRSKFVEG
jgi:hypothetical protein